MNIKKSTCRSYKTCIFLCQFLCFICCYFMLLCVIISIGGFSSVCPCDDERFLVRCRWCSRSIMAVCWRFALPSPHYERELAVLVLPFLDGSSMDVVFASGGRRLGSIRLDSRVAKLESKINYKAKPALCALIRDAQRGECCGRYEIDAIRYLPTDAGAVWRYEVAWAGDPQRSPRASQIFDTHMNAIDATVHVFESQVDVPQRNGCRVNKTYLCSRPDASGYTRFCRDCERSHRADPERVLRRHGWSPVQRHVR